jgi:hypothetical protein
MALGIELNQLSALESSDGAESEFEIDVSYLFIYVLLNYGPTAFVLIL